MTPRIYYVISLRDMDNQTGTFVRLTKLCDNIYAVIDMRDTGHELHLQPDSSGTSLGCTMSVGELPSRRSSKHNKPDDQTKVCYVSQNSKYGPVASRGITCLLCAKGLL